MYKINFYNVKGGIPSKMNTDNHVYETLDEANRELQVLTFNMTMRTYMNYKRSEVDSYVSFTKCPVVYTSIDRTMVLGMESVMHEGKTLYKAVKCIIQICETS